MILVKQCDYIIVDFRVSQIQDKLQRMMVNFYLLYHDLLEPNKFPEYFHILPDAFKYILTKFQTGLLSTAISENANQWKN
jgi:hypothetical protein